LELPGLEGRKHIRRPQPGYLAHVKSLKMIGIPSAFAGNRGRPAPALAGRLACLAEQARRLDPPGSRHY